MATLKQSTGKTLFDLTSYVAVIRVNLSVRLENGEVKKIRGICGRGFETPLANFDQITQSWKMCEGICRLEEPLSLASLPASGMTRNGVLYPQPAWEPITGETASSLWPTPTAHPDNTNTTGKFKNPTLGDAVRMWPTPTVDDSKNVNPKPNRRPGLVSAVQTWPTPTASSWGNEGSRAMLDKHIASGSITEADKRTMTAGNGGKLNPTWVEWLMGFPTGWTDLED